MLTQPDGNSISSGGRTLVCCPGFEDFAKYAVNHPEHDYGVHLDLTCESSQIHWGPLLGAKSVPSLVTPEGLFWPDSVDVMKHATLQDAEKELRAQIELALARGIRLTHLDHHMWVLYTRPDLMDLYLRLGFEYKLAVRFEKIPPQDDVLSFGPEAEASFYRCRDQLIARGFPVFDFIETNNYDVHPRDKRAYYLKQLQMLRPGITEFVVHCASLVPGKDAPPGVLGRAADWRLMASLEFVHELQRLGIETVNYTKLRKMHFQPNDADENKR